MKTQSARLAGFSATLALALGVLSCSSQTPAPPTSNPAPTTDLTSTFEANIAAVVQATLAIQKTADAATATQQVVFQAATNAVATQQAIEQAAEVTTQQAATQAAVEATTSAEAVVVAATQAAEATLNSVEARMASARIVLYEDHGDWVQQALKLSDLSYTAVGDRAGTFLAELTNGEPLDLVIVAQEGRGAVSGEFWEVLLDYLNDGGGVIIEMWSLDRSYTGKIAPLLSQCGLEFYRNMDLAQPIYWHVPEHPIFNTPNVLSPFLDFRHYWELQAGDTLALAADSDAVILGGIAEEQTTRAGVLASCFDGRLLWHTYSAHDYNGDANDDGVLDEIQLWQNMIDYVLRNSLK